jgi:WhiB family redox-sensing transcriptional regulator
MPRIADQTTTGDQGDVSQLLELLDAGRPAWHRDAACREHPEVTWFPGLGQDVRPAKRVCADCLVLSECRSWAIDEGTDLAGIFGGLSDRERRAVRAGKAA